MPKIALVHPDRTKALAVSKGCALNCEHCSDHYLQHMYPIERALEKEWSGEGIRSFLISGGCDEKGAVPLMEHVDSINALSENYRIVAHTGLLDKDAIRTLSPNIDAASFNFIGDDGTITDIYNLDKGVEDFVACYRMLTGYVKTYPHITIGLHGGEIIGEYKALEEISKVGAPAIVFNVFIPTSGTRFSGVKPPSLVDVKKVITLARELMPKTPVYLGCMRPGGKYREELDKMALLMGLDRIVMPSKIAVKLAVSLEYEIEKREECCVL